MSEIFKKFKVLNKLKEEFLNEIKLLYVFEDELNKNVLIVTNNDNIFAFGKNNKRVLGFGNEIQVNELTINKELSQKQIIDFKNSRYHVIARTIDAKVYCWGCNDWGVLGNGKNNEEICKPEFNQYLSDKQIIDICCGAYHTLLLTNSGEVYAWGWNEFGQIGNERNGSFECQSIPIKVNGFNNEKVIRISCGYRHSMALTESDRVFSWGYNSRGQLGYNNIEGVNKPSLVLISNEISIKKISCGRDHSLLLSRDAHIYWFGENVIETQKTPKKLTINKFIDIESNYNFKILTALSVNGIYYVWGEFGEKEPKETEFKSFNDIFIHYFGITHKTHNFFTKKQKQLLQNQTSRHLKTSENFDLKVDLQNLENNKYEKEFEEKNLIGCGSFGIVYKAIEISNGKVYAIKKIAFNDKDIERVSKELNVITELKCDFVAEFITFWVENNYIKAGDYTRDNKDKSISSGQSF
jgi:hypothetical protein